MPCYEYVQVCYVMFMQVCYDYDMLSKVDICHDYVMYAKLRKFYARYVRYAK